jgi:DNA recombination protein RmuC
MSESQLLLFAVGAAILVVGGVLLLLWGVRRRPDEGTTASGGTQAILADLGARLGQVSGELQGVARAQEGLRSDVTQTREQAQFGLAQTAEGLTRQIHETRQALTEVAGLLQRTVQTQAALAQQLSQTQGLLQGSLHQAQQGLQAEIAETRALVAQVQATQEAREPQEAQARDAIRRLEHVLAGSKSRGMAGENILAGVLAQLPPELRETNLTINNKPVEFALRLPHGRLLPIDSKWPALGPLERLQAAEDPAERRGLTAEIQAEVKRKVREVVKYLDADRTLGLGVLAVPDAVFEACWEVHVEACKLGVVIVSYSQALPYLLSLLQLVHRFGTEFDRSRLSQSLQTIAAALERMDGEVDGRLAKTVTQLENSRAELKAQLGRGRQGLSAIRLDAEPGTIPEPPPDPGS